MLKQTKSWKTDHKPTKQTKKPTKWAYFMVTPHFRGIFGEAKESFGRNLENLFKNIFYFSEP